MEAGHPYVLPQPPPPPRPPPEPPDPDREPRWPAWYGPVAFLAGVVATFIAIVAVDTALTAGGGHPNLKSPALTDISTVIQDAAFLATAFAFASMTARPRLWHFGLRGRPLLNTAKWAGIGYLSFWLVAIVYELVFAPHGKQTVTQDLGVSKSHAALIAGGFVVLVVAPFCEEVFFRGFFYRALRNRFNLWVAAVIDGLVFGLIHYTGSGTLSLLPVLALLGFMFCLVYERTGTIYATIALHSLNNSIAYATQAHGAVIVSAVFGGAMLVAMAVATVVTPRGPVRASP